MSKTFLIYHSTLQISGIERWIIKQIEFAKNNGISVIWLNTGAGDIYEGWKNLVRDSTIKIDVEGEPLDAIKTQLYEHLSTDDDIIAVCFTFFEYFRLLSLKRDCGYHNMSCYNIIPHFEMARYYPEDLYEEAVSKKHALIKSVRKHVRRKAGEIYKLCEDKRLLFFNERHIQEIESRYGVSVSRKKDKLLRKTLTDRPFNEEQIRQKRNLDYFRIITCGRFDFPHKGYMIGLIKTYNKLKSEFPQLQLDLIGYGDYQTLEKIVQECTPEARKDINFIGEVKPEDLNKYFDKAHLNISVAGGVTSGALAGVVSLPARHYTYDCEVYGYLPESISHKLSEEPGEDAEQYIREIISLPPDKYVKLCRDSYETLANNEPVDELWLFSLENSNEAEEKIIIKKYEKLLRFINRSNKIISCLSKIRHP